MTPTKEEDREAIVEIDKLGMIPPKTTVILVGVLLIVTLRLAGPHLDNVGLVALVVVELGMFMTLFLGWVGWRIVQFCVQAPKQKSVDISHLCTTPSPQVQPIVKALLQLGFRRLGETRTQFSFGEPKITWILTNPQATVVAEAVEVVEGDPSAVLLFITVYNDQAVVETAYPTGTRIKTATFRSFTVTTSVQDAYEYHLEQVAKFGAAHGSLSRIEHMTSFFSLNTTYGLRYERRKLRGVLWEGILLLTALGWSLVTLLSFVSFFLTRPSSEIVVRGCWSMILQLALAALISNFVAGVPSTKVSRSFK